MNPKVKIAGLSVAGVSLFTLAFVAFTALAGVPMHEAALIKHFVDPPEVVEEEELAEGELPKDPVDKMTQQEVIEASSSVVSSFVLPSPFSTDELEMLQSDLKMKKLDYENRLRKLRERESALGERELLVEERYSELADLRESLQKFELELSLRAAEVKRDTEAQNAREKKSWDTIAKLFEEGDAEDLVKKLVTYSPEDAAKILSALTVDRMRELTGALPVEQYQEYMQAYRKTQTQGE